jgi:rubrerythrin
VEGGKAMSQEDQADVSSTTTETPPLTEILDTHAKLETRVGEIYVNFATTCGHNADLKTMWSAMALEEGGHAALIRAVNKGLLSGVFQAKSFLLPLDIIDALVARVTEYHQQSQGEVSLDQALRITWELECSELDFLRELLVASSNLAELGFPTNVESKDKHLGRLRELIQQYATDEGLRREVKFLSAERFPR